MPALACLIFGAGVGACQAQDSTRREDTVIVKTKYVDRPVDRKVTVIKVSIPSSCAEALNQAGQIKADALVLVGVSTIAQDILSDGHEALTNNDGTEVNNQRDKLYKLRGRSDGASQDISLITIPKLDDALRECKATKAYKEKK